VDAKLQRRIQRYGWDLAADCYEQSWQAQLACAQTELLARAALRSGDRVLDVACGTGLVTFGASEAVGSSGWVLGVDISSLMINAASQRAQQRRLSNVGFQRMDAESLDLPDVSFDVALCALGLMYVPDADKAVREMLRVLRPGGRIVLAVWGERSRCGWAAIFPIVEAEVASDVCPLFFGLGQADTLARLCTDARLQCIEQQRIVTTLDYANGDEACDAAFIGGPAALAWSRFDAETRARVRARYIEAIEPWRAYEGYQIPGEFVIVSATTPTA
jgi:SAM-dependent methyltransferase